MVDTDRTALGFDKGTLARTPIGLCGQVASLPDRRQAYGSSPLVKSLHRHPRRLTRRGRLRTELILAVIGVVLEVVLVLGLGLPEGAGLADLGHYLAVPDP
jgi:hypothetical protein